MIIRLPNRRRTTNSLGPQKPNQSTLRDSPKYLCMPPRVSKCPLKRIEPPYSLPKQTNKKI